MTRINIELPEPLKVYVEEESRRRGFHDPGEFVRSLLEAEQHRQIDQPLEAALQEGLDSPLSPWTIQDVDDIRREGLRLIQARTAK